MRLDFLLKGYDKGGCFINKQGFNVHVIDLDPVKVGESDIPVDR